MTQKIEFDSSVAHQMPQPVQDWEAPPHVYYGPRQASGKLAKEPVYAHQAFPKVMYRKRDDGTIGATQIRDESEYSALGKEWRESPSEFGYIGAPTLDQSMALAKQEQVADAQRKASEQQAALIAVGLAKK